MFTLKLCVVVIFFKLIHCEFQVGPDPWEVNDKLSNIPNELDIPPDLRAIPEKKNIISNGAGAGSWFYKRMLAIILKAGQVKKEEDGTVVVSLQMQFDKERWLLLEGYTALNFDLTEDVARRSMGYIEEAIYKPTIIEKAAVAWTEYIQLYLVDYKVKWLRLIMRHMENNRENNSNLMTLWVEHHPQVQHYKEYITWTFGALAFLAAAIWLWKHMSHTHIYIVVFILLYLYEVFTSYKEAEKEDLQRFLSAVNNCKWYFWSSSCVVPPADPLTFIKHMSPLKIGIRMFSTVITEPIICINDAVKTLIHGITDGMWFPFGKIVYAVLILKFNIIFILFMIMIIFNYILNIPFNFSYFGLLNIGLKQRNRAFNTSERAPETSDATNCDRISGDTLNRLLDVCSRALNTAATTQSSQNKSNVMLSLTNTNACKMRRSASTGRLPNNNNDFTEFDNENYKKLNEKSRKLNKMSKLNGGGDRL